MAIQRLNWSKPSMSRMYWRLASKLSAVMKELQAPSNSSIILGFSSRSRRTARLMAPERAANYCTFLLLRVIIENSRITRILTSSTFDTIRSDRSAEIPPMRHRMSVLEGAFSIISLISSILTSNSSSSSPFSSRFPSLTSLAYFIKYSTHLTNSSS